MTPSSTALPTQRMDSLCKNAASDGQKAASMQARQVQAEEEARLALLTHQAGMKLTLTQQVPALFLAALFHTAKYIC